jgi:hypothetical protein
VLIAAPFVVVEGLGASGLTAWTGRQLVERGNGNPRGLTMLIMPAVAVLSALISFNGLPPHSSLSWSSSQRAPGFRPRNCCSRWHSPHTPVHCSL